MSEYPATARPPILVMMGVAGCGKTTVGLVLAARLGWSYQEGDELHPQANIEKMRAGIPLDDEDRAPWLAEIARWIDGQARDREPGVIGCSALKRRYRDSLRVARPQIWFVYLQVPRPELVRRVRSRQHRYMPASLLDSQLEALEEPQADEPRTLTIEAGGTIEAAVAAAMRTLESYAIVSPKGEDR